jgi:hypothetical protein
MQLRDIVLSEVIQTKQDTDHMFLSYMEDKGHISSLTCGR